MKTWPTTCNKSINRLDRYLLVTEVILSYYYYAYKFEKIGDKKQRDTRLREAWVLEQVLLLGRKYSELSKVLNVTGNRVRQIYVCAKRRLKHELHIDIDLEKL